MIESFDAKQFPWFGDDFIHPNDLPRECRGAPLINLFEGFAMADWFPRERSAPNLVEGI